LLPSAHRARQLSRACSASGGPRDGGPEGGSMDIVQRRDSLRRPRMSHPDPHGPPDRTPIKVGEVWENPTTRERAMILELPWENQAGRGTAELTALVGARVMGEHLHPALVERFTPLEGELTVKRNGQTSILRQGQTAVIEPSVWHD